jgi:alpha-tubulin suppressor-like RCC1 family protein
VDIGVGDYQTCARTAAGQIQCWGSQYAGALGDGIYTDSPHALAVQGGLRFTDLAVGTSISGPISCGLIAGGDAYCWPYNGSHTPALLPGGLQFTSLRAGGSMVCGVAIGGAAYCWGYDGVGQLGNGTVSVPGDGFRTPQLVVGGLQFASITTGSQHACGLTTGGVAYCWGDKSFHQLGAPASRIR